QFVQTVNTSVAVFHKTTGAILAGPAPISALFSTLPAGSQCPLNNDGDPIVIFDKINSRWLISQLSVSTTPFAECIAVSQTADATGSFWLYEFDYGADFDDYPKLAAWPSAYYATYNMFDAAGTTFLGAEICAMDQANMLNGNPATQICFGPNPSQ